MDCAVAFHTYGIFSSARRLNAAMWYPFMEVKAK